MGLVVEKEETYGMRTPFSIVRESDPLGGGGVHLLALIVLNLRDKHNGPSISS